RPARITERDLGRRHGDVENENAAEDTGDLHVSIWRRGWRIRTGNWPLPCHNARSFRLVPARVPSPQSPVPALKQPRRGDRPPADLHLADDVLLRHHAPVAAVRAVV